MIPELTYNFADGSYIWWASVLFFQVIPEDSMFDSHKLLGLICSYSIRGYLPGRGGLKDTSNWQYIRRLIREEYDIVQGLEEEKDLWTMDHVLYILERIRTWIELAEYDPKTFHSRELIHLSEAANLLGIGMVSIITGLLGMSIPLFTNKYKYLYMRRDDLPRFIDV